MSTQWKKNYQNFQIKPGIYILFVKFENLSTPRQAPMLKTGPCYSLIHCQSIKKISNEASLQVTDFLIPMRTFESSPLHDPQMIPNLRPTSNELLHNNPLFSVWGTKERPSNVCIIYWAKTRIRELLLLTPLDKPKVTLKKSSWTNYIPNINNLVL